MVLKRILTTLVLLSVVATVGYAQETTGGLTVRTSPPGAEVTLVGDATVVGVSPTTFQQRLVGEYRVIVKKFGFENYKSRTVLDPSKQIALDIKLVPKTRLKAAARSLFIPGWGQRYSDQKGRGLLFTVAAAASIGAFLLADQEFNYRNDLFKTQKQRYDSAAAHGASYADLQSIHGELAATQKKAYDRENLRRGTIGAVIGIWGLNVLDALLFSPGDRGSFTVSGVSLGPTKQPGSLGLSLTRRF